MWPRWSWPNDHGSVTARLGHSSVMARSRLGHSSVTWAGHSSITAITARSQLNHGPGHGSVTADCDHFGHSELTVNSPWAHRELTVTSHCGQIFSHGKFWKSCISGMGGLIDEKWKVNRSVRGWTTMPPYTLWLQQWPWPWSKFEIRNGWTDWHGMEGIWVCHLRPWP